MELLRMTDEELVTRITKGETEMYSEIIERYGDKLARYVQRIINQEREEVEDVVEDTLIAAYRNLNSYKAGYKFSSWIYRIGHNRAIDWMRKQKIKTENIEGMEEFIGNGEEEIEDGLIRSEDQERVGRMLGLLPQREREILELYYFEDQNYEDIADILKISTNNVAVRLNRAKKKLKYIWEKYEKAEK